MAVFRVDKTADYTVMSNTHLREREMSLKAKGLLSLMLSLPDTWDYSIEGLVAICKENETAIKSTLNELKKFGYLEVFKLLPNQTGTGRIDYIYQVYERPKKQEGKKQGVENLGVEFLGVENQAVEIQAVENQGQLNTNILNTKKENTKQSNTKKQKAVYFPQDEKLNEAFYDFVDMRKKIKSPLTDKAIKRAINKLNDLSKGDSDLAIQIIEESVFNCWKDFYPLKNKPTQSSTGNAFLDKWANV